MLRRVILVAIIEKEGKYLLTKQNEGYHKGYWGFPGGNIEESDSGLEERLAKEVTEEVGLFVTNSRYIGSCAAFVEKEELHLVWVFFKVEVDKGELALGSEIGEYKWLSVDELVSFPREKIRPPVIWYEKVMQLVRAYR